MKNLLILYILPVFVMPMLAQAQVGVGALVPSSMLHVADTVTGTSSWKGSFIDIQNVSSILNTSAGIRFKVDDNVNNEKYRAGIFFKRNTANANGSLIFSNSDITSTGNVTSTTNARMTITATGLVGIGITTPDHLLSIVGSNATTDGSNGVFMDVQNSDLTHGVISGIRFRNGITDQTFKGGIFYQDKLGYGRGDIIFANNSHNYEDNVSLDDTRLIIKNNGNIGIGTTDPEEIFHVYESGGGLDVKFESDNGNPKIYMDGTTGSTGLFYEKNGVLKANMGYNITSDYIYFTHGQTIAMKGGNLGIGVLAPQYPLHVNKVSSDCEMLLKSSSNRAILRMDGMAGLSEMRFQSNGTYKAAIGYNHDNDNLFMYHNGNLKFSDGELYVTDDYNYISAKTYTIQYPACAFQLSTNSAETENVWWDEDGYFKITGWVSLNYAPLCCPLNLPDGAVIASMNLISYVVSDFPYVENYCNIKLYRRALTATSSVEMASINVDDTAGSITIESTTTISNSTIDNSSYQYFMECEVGDETTKFYGAYITYSILKISQ